MSEETVWQGLAAILPIFHWTVLPLNETLPRRRDGCPGTPIRVSYTRLHFKVSPLARSPGICETASRPLSRKLDARALDFAPLLVEPQEDELRAAPRRGLPIPSHKPQDWKQGRN